MSHLLPMTTMPAHLEESVVRDVTCLTNSPARPAAPIPPPPQVTSSVALSFAFDAAAKTLNVVIRDERSGEVVRTIAYTHMPADMHQNNKLNGLLMDQFV